MFGAVGRHSFRTISSSAFLALSLVSTTPSSACAWSNGGFSSYSSPIATNLVSATRLFSDSSSSSSSSSMMASTGSRSNTCPSSSAAATLTVAQFPCLSDNYGYLIHDATTGHTAAVDTPEAAAYEAELQKRGWTLTHIFNTHHHWDHTGANLELKTDSVKIYGPATEKIPGIDVPLNGGDEIEFGSSKVKIMDVGGHTKGHIAYYFPDDAKVFVGDSLFALGCGKMFEGTPAQFWTSLKGLRELPDETVVYCAHEYTASNAKFAASVEPGNVDLMERVAQVNTMRANAEPTVPSLMGVEKKTNPFLRCDISKEIRTNVGVVDSDSDAEAFGKVRRAKDTFRG